MWSSFLDSAMELFLFRRRLPGASRFWRAKHRLALIGAGTYWFIVLYTCIVAATSHDLTGMQWIPFMYLTLPWSSLLVTAAYQIRACSLPESVYWTVSFLVSGVNALIIYFVIAGASNLID